MSTESTGSIDPTNGMDASDPTASMPKEIDKPRVEQVGQDDRVAHGKELQKWFIGVGTAIALLLLGGAAHGLLSNRWGISEDILLLGKKLSEIPTEIGPW